MATLRPHEVTLNTPIPGERTGSLQVYCGDDFIGWLDVPYPKQEGAIYVAEPTELQPLPEDFRFQNQYMNNVPSNVIGIRIRKRNVRIDDFSLQTYGENHLFRMRERYNVPSNSVANKDQLSGDLIISWLAAEVSLDVSETVFDLDQFIPSPK